MGKRREQPFCSRIIGDVFQLNRKGRRKKGLGKGPGIVLEDGVVERGEKTVEKKVYGKPASSH